MKSPLNVPQNKISHVDMANYQKATIHVDMDISSNFNHFERKKYLCKVVWWRDKFVGLEHTFEHRK